MLFDDLVLVYGMEITGAPLLGLKAGDSDSCTMSCGDFPSEHLTGNALYGRVCSRLINSFDSPRFRGALVGRHLEKWAPPPGRNAGVGFDDADTARRSAGVDGASSSMRTVSRPRRPQLFVHALQ